MGCFNPRAPRGARLLTSVPPDAVKEFQSTRPAWGATDGSGNLIPNELFQSTRPAWGATRP